MGKREICSDENPLSEGHLRNAFVISRCSKSGCTDRLTCKHTGGSAGSHTLTYMLHLAETERKREGQLMREVEGGAAVHWENEWHRAEAARRVEKKWSEIFSDCTGSIFFSFFVLFLFVCLL